MRAPKSGSFDEMGEGYATFKALEMANKVGAAKFVNGAWIIKDKAKFLLFKRKVGRAQLKKSAKKIRNKYKFNFKTGKLERR